MNIRIPRNQRTYAVLKDEDRVAMVLGRQGYDEGDPVSFIFAPGGEPFEGRDADVLLYVDQPGIGDGSAVARLADEYGLEDESHPTLEQDAARATAVVGRMKNLDDSFGEE